MNSFLLNTHSGLSWDHLIQSQLNVNGTLHYDQTLPDEILTLSRQTFNRYLLTNFPIKFHRALKKERRRYLARIHSRIRRYAKLIDKISLRNLRLRVQQDQTAHIIQTPLPAEESYDFPIHDNLLDLNFICCI